MRGSCVFSWTPKRACLRNAPVLIMFLYAGPIVTLSVCFHSVYNEVIGNDLWKQKTENNVNFAALKRLFVVHAIFTFSVFLKHPRSTGWPLIYVQRGCEKRRRDLKRKWRGRERERGEGKKGRLKLFLVWHLHDEGVKELRINVLMEKIITISATFGRMNLVCSQFCQWFFWTSSHGFVWLFFSGDPALDIWSVPVHCRSCRALPALMYVSVGQVRASSRIATFHQHLKGCSGDWRQRMLPYVGRSPVRVRGIQKNIDYNH